MTCVRFEIASLVAMFATAPACGGYGSIFGGSPCTHTYGDGDTRAAPGGVVGRLYDYEFLPSCSRWGTQLTDGALPPGLTLGDHDLTGVPTEPGTYHFTLAFDDIEADISLAVTSDPLMVVTRALDRGTLGQGYSLTLAATGGSARGYGWRAESALPPGLVLEGDTLRGIPTTLGSTPVLVAVTDAWEQRASASLVLTVYATPEIEIVLDGLDDTPHNPAQLPFARLDTPLDISIASRLGSGADVRWSHTPELPDGLSLVDTSSAVVRVVGTPRTAGRHLFRLRVRDSEGEDEEVFALPVASSPLVIEPSLGFERAYVGRGYTATFTARGGDGTRDYSWERPSRLRAPPPGLGFIERSPGVLTLEGRPQVTGRSRFPLTLREGSAFVTLEVEVEVVE